MQFIESQQPLILQIEQMKQTDDVVIPVRGHVAPRQQTGFSRSTHHSAGTELNACKKENNCRQNSNNYKISPTTIQLSNSSITTLTGSLKTSRWNFTLLFDWWNDWLPKHHIPTIGLSFINIAAVVRFSPNRCSRTADIQIIDGCRERIIRILGW